MKKLSGLIIPSAVVLSLLMPHLLPSAQTTGTDREIIAERITIKDKAGNTRASLNESGLVIFDTAHKIRVGVGTMSDGTPLVSLYEKTGEVRALMSLERRWVEPTSTDKRTR
jgi:hypothetical protein